MPLGWETFCLPYRGRRELGLTLKKLRFQKAWATNTKPCTAVSLKFSLTFPEFEWGLRGRRVTAGGGIPNCFWKEVSRRDSL